MGFNLIKTIMKKVGANTERTSSIEITSQQIEEAAAETALRELAFWTCVGKISNALTKCEFRTFVKGKEVFDEEYYLWNVEPNKNQNKAQFLGKAMEKLYRDNKLLIVESNDGQLLVADGFSVSENVLYGNTYSQVSVDGYTFSRIFKSTDVLYMELNNKDVNAVLSSLFQSYNKLIDYASKSFLKSRGSRGILEIGAMAYQDKNFDENLKKLMNEYFKSFFNSSNAVLPLHEGYKYTDLGSKTYNETTSRDIKSQYDDIFDFTARAFSMPPSLAKGDVQDTSKAVDEMLTFCIDPLVNMISGEINRKRNGRALVREGTYLSIDVTKVKHIDMFDISGQADKLISSGIYTINMLLRALGEPQIEEPWANQHFITKNYSTIQELLNQLKGDETDGNTD